MVPSARVRHLGQLRQRRPDLRHGLMRARHRMRSVATLTGASRLPARSIEMVLLTLVELVVGLFTARFGQAWNSFRALLGLVPRTPALLARRREVKPIRRVPEREVYSLQERGSARLNGYLRSRETSTYVGSGVQVRRWRQSATAPVIAWLAIIGGLIIGARSFFDGGLPPVGEFLAFPESPRQLLDTFLSGWNPNGAGATSPNPTGWASLSGLSVVTLFHMGLLQTLFVLGLLLVGSAGVWRLSAVFTSTRARIAALLVYSLSPIVSGAMSGGRLTVIVVYAATPWLLHLTRRASGIETADPGSAELDVVDGVIDLTPGERVRRILAAALVLALAVAFAPVMLPLAVVLAAGPRARHGAGARLARHRGMVAGRRPRGRCRRCGAEPAVDHVVDVGGSRRRASRRRSGPRSGAVGLVRDRQHRLRRARPRAVSPRPRRRDARPRVEADLGDPFGADGAGVRSDRGARRRWFHPDRHARSRRAARPGCARRGDLGSRCARSVRSRRPRRLVRMASAARDPVLGRGRRRPRSRCGRAGQRVVPDPQHAARAPARRIASRRVARRRLQRPAARRCPGAARSRHRVSRRGLVGDHRRRTTRCSRSVGCRPPMPHRPWSRRPSTRWRRRRRCERDGSSRRSRSASSSCRSSTA